MVKKYVGYTFNQWAAVAIVIIVASIGLGIGPINDWYQDRSSSTASIVGSGNMVLDSEFVSVVADSSIIADVDTNFNDATNTIALQFDSDRTNVGGTTTFRIKTKNVTGDVVNVAVSGVTDAGNTILVPTTDLTATVTINLDESVVSGFSIFDVIHRTLSDFNARITCT